MSVNNCLSVTHKGMPVAYDWRNAVIRQSAIGEEFGVSAVLTHRRKRTGNMACALLHS